MSLSRTAAARWSENKWANGGHWQTRVQKRATSLTLFARREFPASSPFSRRAQSDFPASELIDGSARSGLMREEWRARKREIKSAEGKRPRWNHALIKAHRATKEEENSGSLFVEGGKKNNFNPLHKFTSWQHQLRLCAIHLRSREWIKSFSGFWGRISI